MLLYEHLLNDYIDFRKNRKDEGEPTSKVKHSFNYKEKFEAFFSDIGLHCIVFLFIVILALFIIFSPSDFIKKCIFSFLIDIAVTCIFICFYNPKLKEIRRENTNTYFEDFIQTFIYDKDRNYNWYIEDHIDDLISWCNEKGEKIPSWYADLHLPDDPIWSLIMAGSGFALALIGTGNRNYILLGIAIIITLVIVYAIAYTLKEYIYSTMFPHKVAAKELADDFKCAKLVLTAKEKGKHTESNKN